MPISMNNNVSQTVSAQKVSKSNQASKKTEKAGMSIGAKVAIGTGLAALAAVGIYIATKGKGKASVSALGKEKVFKDGTKVTREIADGKTVMKVFDKEGKLIRTRTKEITRSTNPANGKKYVTIKKNDLDNAKTTSLITNKYYSKDGKRLFETHLYGKDGVPDMKLRMSNGNELSLTCCKNGVRSHRYGKGDIIERFSDSGTKIKE